MLSGWMRLSARLRLLSVRQGTGLTGAVLRLGELTEQRLVVRGDTGGSLCRL
jgi:alpha-D-ribose 1-methylphosphonate 5-triphosphate synthase subunit PhnG